MADHITPHPAYDTVDRDDFNQMMEVERYGRRSSDFDSIISATVDHFWDPIDPVYIDFDQTFDTKNEMILPRDFVAELNCGQLDVILRSRFLVDTILLAKVQGLPFMVSEVRVAIEKAAGTVGEGGES